MNLLEKTLKRINSTPFFIILALFTGITAGFVQLQLPHPLLLVILFIGLAVALCLFMKPEWGLLFMIFMIYTKLSYVLINYHGLPSIGKPVVLLMLLIILARWIWFGEKPENWLPATFILGGYAFLAIYSGTYAPDLDLVQEALGDFVKDAVILYIIATQIKNRSTFRRVIWILLLGGAFLGTISTYQYLTGTFENDYWGFGQASIENIVSDTEEDDYRIGGPGFGPNYYGIILLLVVPLALDRIWSEKKRIYRMIAGWTFFVTVLSIFVTFSRTAFLGLVAVLGFLFIRRPPKPSALIFTIIILGVSTLYMPAKFTNRLKELGKFLPGASSADVASDASFSGRLSENISAIQMFNDHPVRGVGLGNYEHYYQSYAQYLGLDSRREVRAAHSLYLENISELGVLGLCWLLGLQWLTFTGLFQADKNFRAAGKPEDAYICYAIEATIIGFLVTGIFTHLAHPRFFWMLYGIALSVPNVARKELAASTG
ncbi:MAG: O-antigen ligase family protein [Candidatus Electrothrix sp. GW3-4]|uniref:O-antigen ligase family protein n=1 Tax=Candidatus Electrothrix sp. GW3-4 TaxID=3126740 RepID=UPI0030D3E5DC